MINKKKMLKQIKILLYILMLALFSCCLNSSDKSSNSDESYITENINFYNQSAHIKIAGTLTYPKDKGPFPTVVLIPGSGNTDRDGSDNEIHRPLFEIADYLTRKGMAVLRCDKRGVGESEGVLDYNTTLADLASDVKASINYLNNNAIIDKDQLGLIGHSNGGLVAAIVAGDLPSISFVVLLASPGIKHGQIVSQQLSDIPKAFGVSDKTINKFQIIIDSTVIIMSSRVNPKIQSEKVEEMYERRINQVTDDEIEAMSKIGYVFQRDANVYSSMVMMPFWNEFYTLDPKSILIQIKCPVLSIIGENDMQVKPGPNQEAIKLALEAGNNENYTIITPKRMNHLFQISKSGSPEEYYKTKETMSKSVLDKINNWILDQLDN
jgi:pimeloyl-ACP methyl ester carboxylesterase